MNGTNDDKTVLISVESLQPTGNECRVCLEKCNLFWQIFHPTDEEISKKLMAFAAVQVKEGDGLPATICHNCRRLLDISYNFKCQVEKSDARLREIFALKKSVEKNEKMLSVSAITDATAEEPGSREVGGCDKLVESLSDRTSHDIVVELGEHHHYVEHGAIIFHIEPPSVPEQCVSIVRMESQVPEIVDSKHLLDECGGNPVVNELIDKYEEMVDSDMTREAFKSEPMMMQESDVENDDDDSNGAANEVCHIDDLSEKSTDCPISRQQTDGNIDAKMENMTKNSSGLAYHIGKTEPSENIHCSAENMDESENQNYQSLANAQENQSIQCTIGDLIKSSSMECRSTDESPMGSANIEESRIDDRTSNKNGENLKIDKDAEEEERPLISRTNRLKCPNCIKTFGSKTSLERHAKIHKKKPKSRHVCPVCDKQLASMTKLKNHLISSHEASENEERTERGASDELIKGDKNGSDAKRNMKYSCAICGKQFTYQKSFLSHAKSHPGYEPVAIAEKEDNDRGPESEDEDPLECLQCTQCGKLFATKRNLKRHMTTHSGLKFNCSTCSKEFSRIDKLKEHEQSKHKEEFFASSDTGTDDDTDNENKHHDGSESRKKEKHNRPHKCPMCPKAFAQEYSLTNHMERHKRVKDTQKRFLCEVCSKCFAQSGSLVAHMRTHTGIKPYVCRVCSRAFTKSTYLQLHLRTHSGEKPYICQYCSRAFARANTLARHITMHTGEAKYHCQICMKSFRRLTSLNEHTYTHTGQRPYACKICSKRYNNAGSLYAHTKKCKTQQTVEPQTNFTISIDDTIHDKTGTTSSSSQMIIYPQRKLSEDSAVEPVQSTAQFAVSNLPNASLKTLPNNVIPHFTIEEPNFCNLNTKQYKSPYYIYPNM